MAESDDSILILPGYFREGQQPEKKCCEENRHDFQLFGEWELQLVPEVKAYNADPTGDGIPTNFCVQCVLCGEMTTFSSDELCIKCLSRVVVTAMGQVEMSELSKNYKRARRIGECQNDQCNLRVTWMERSD